MLFRARKHQFDLSKQVLIMGVINVTPDSFSDGGKFLDPEKAVCHALQLESEGADILDVGAVSTRPGAPEVSEEEERARLMPVLERVCRRVSALISVDTTSPRIASEALELGAHIVNDVSGLKSNPALAEPVAKYQSGIILMHRRGNPRSMQNLAQYTNLIADVKSELRESIQIARSYGISDEAIVVDPGIGFAKTPVQNLEILNRLKEFEDLGFPVMVGPSNKSFIGDVLKREVSERKIGTIASCVLAVREGARILRVHDVQAAKEAAEMTLAIIQQEEK
ncbi:MAG: dihydropteroate synthase [Candidatus Omnitrophica bacterium]|nr:dihydropteroate synthase [Candidatus Omnitrophota bacterium]